MFKPIVENVELMKKEFTAWNGGEEGNRRKGELQKNSNGVKGLHCIIICLLLYIHSRTIQLAYIAEENKLSLTTLDSSLCQLNSSTNNHVLKH